MIYDDASWHSGGDFPVDLPPEAGGTHIGLFLAWMLLNGQGGERHAGEFGGLTQRAQTPGEWFMAACDGKLMSEDLSVAGNAFATAYYLYDEDGHEDGDPSYLPDYAKSFADAPNAYSVPDTWASYDRLAPLLAARFAMWQGRIRHEGQDNGL
ncbi:hypothetical protein [Sandaracinobacter sp.]|uniref:DUF7832 domain-containing protein n=1 Tax=Sandaracinobacter sp. TaxID=2487581 RepID=UPI0035B2C6D1